MEKTTIEELNNIMEKIPEESSKEVKSFLLKMNGDTDNSMKTPMSYKDYGIDEIQERLKNIPRLNLDQAIQDEREEKI